MMNKKFNVKKSVENNHKMTEREELLKNYVKRLTNGDDLDDVRADFKENFSDVSAIEIARAEQSLLNDGTPLSDVQRLCDVHSALFHGATTTERIQAAEEEVARSLQAEKKAAEEKKTQDVVTSFGEDIAEKIDTFEKIPGHPLNILNLENIELKKLLERIDKIADDKKSADIVELLKPEIMQLLSFKSHYEKKDELMYPLLSDKYNFPGPSNVMWGVEIEIIKSLKELLNTENGNYDSRNPYMENFNKTIKRIKEMIYKEDRILFPLCGRNFTEDEWIAIARDMPEFGYFKLSKAPVWEKVIAIENEKQESYVTVVNDPDHVKNNDEQGKLCHDDKKIQDGENKISVHLPGGDMTLVQLRAVLNTLPMEITVIDDQDINRFFNEGEKFFKRPKMAVGRKVYSCHPKHVEPLVRMLIHDFKTGKKDSMSIWGEKEGQPVLINYYALRDPAGKYLGTMEAVQLMGQIIDSYTPGKKGPMK